MSGGFLAGLSIQLPPGLTCIIGPRGSGKSTLAEAIRYMLLGSSDASKARLDLLQANLRGSLITLGTAPDDRGTAYILRRTYQQPGLVARDLVEMYRYVSDRLRHELQNALLGPKTRLLRLIQTIARLDEGVTKAELASLIAQLQDEFTVLGRFAEVEPNDAYFALRPVLLTEWLPRMNAEYAARYSRVDLQIDGDDEALSTHVLGSDYLLRLVFWNLWVNAHQAAGSPCSITLRCERRGDTLSVVVSDNGTGFPADMVGVAFEYRYSQRGPNRGRGLLEVQDAIQQLGGDSQLIEVSPGEHRVQLTFSTKTR